MTSQYVFRRAPCSCCTAVWLAKMMMQQDVWQVDTSSRTLQVLAHLASVPRLTAKLRCALFRRQAAGLIADASSALRCVQTAGAQVRLQSCSY